MTHPSPMYFYTTDSWDEAAWIDVISIEYESLVSAYPFETKFRQISSEGLIRVLDVGCGSAIFPQFLDRTLADGTHLTCDLLDISQRSLKQAEAVMDELEHFSIGRSINTNIEDILGELPPAAPGYDVIWAIHSLTTVDQKQMPDVFEHLLRLLSPSGQLYLYQLAADSAYQTFHKVYRERVSSDVPRFMEFEDSARILDSLAVEYDVIELQFEHVLPRDRPDLIENYLRKCVLDDTIDTDRVFGDLLPRYVSGGLYRIPQFVNFISVSRP